MVKYSSVNMLNSCYFGKYPAVGCRLPLGWWWWWYNSRTVFV